MPTEVSASISPDFLEHVTAGMKGAAEPMGDGALPPGTYTARFTGPEAGVGRKTGTAYINLHFEVLGPIEKLIGQPAKAHFNLITPQNFEMFKKQVRRMGVTSDEASEVFAALNTLTGRIFQITAKDNGPYKNLYVNREVTQD